MTVTAPPRPAHSGDPIERAELETLVNALIEEARQRARRRRRIYTALAALAALVAFALLTVFERGAHSQTASPAASARSSLPVGAAKARIAFISTPRFGGGLGRGELYIVNADGSGKRLLTDSWYSTPAWSPDGRRIAFGGRGVSIMNADGSGERMLAPNAAVPAWSPDGRRIAFLQGNGRVAGPGQWNLYLMTAGGDEQRRLTRNAWLAAPVWSADGRKLLFVSQRAGNNEVHVVNADGSGQRNLTRNAAGDHSPAWSPDGQKIAFVRDFEIYVMNVDGSGQQRLTHDTAHDFGPAWSPDGQKIAFERRLGRQTYGKCGACGRASSFEIHVMNPDGTGQQRLTRRGAQPLWASDGRRIAFVSERDGHAEVYVMNADGSGQRNLTRNRLGHERWFAWSPGQNP